MDYNKVEDSVLKKAMEVFQQNAVNFFKINAKIVAPAETEIKSIKIKTNFMDYLFYTDDGNYLHFEFQTTMKKDDIKRFLYYDASLFYKEKRKVRTIVIYSSDIVDSDEYVDAGTIKYSIEAFYMKNLDGDKTKETLFHKISNNIELTSEDILSLTFLPLMRSNESREDRVLESIKMADSINNSEIKLQSLSMLYALLEKFGDRSNKKKFKEVFSMTEIGKMLREDGKEEGKKEGKAEMLIKQLTKKFNKVPDDYKKILMELPEERLEIIAIEIFNINSIEEIEKYF